MSAPYDAVLFDFDGVLADSEPVHWAAWMEALEPTGIRMEWDDFQRECVGVADLAMLEVLVRYAPQPVEADSLRAYYPAKRDVFRRRIAAVDLCPPETVALIHSLDAYPLAVVTSSVREEVEPVLDRAGILSRLRTAVYGDDVERRKPAPDPYLLAAARLGARRPLVVEDSDAGAASGRSAGFDVLRVAAAGEVAPKLAAALGILL